MPAYVKKVAFILFMCEFVIELGIGFYLAIDLQVLNLDAEDIFYFLGVFLFINIFATVAMLVKGYSQRNWYLVARTRVITFLCIFLVFITAAPGIISGHKVYVDAAFGTFYIISIVFNLVSIWMIQEAVKYKPPISYVRDAIYDWD